MAQRWLAIPPGSAGRHSDTAERFHLRSCYVNDDEGESKYGTHSAPSNLTLDPQSQKRHSQPGGKVA